jgi:hypothetical protein
VEGGCETVNAKDIASPFVMMMDKNNLRVADVIQKWIMDNAAK